MQAQHGRKQFVVEHILISAAVLAALVSVVTLIATLALTGDLPGIRQADSEGSAISSSADVPESRVGVGAGEGWLGAGQGAEDASVVTEMDRADMLTQAQLHGLLEFDRMEQAPNLSTRSERLTGPGEGLNDYRFIEENTFGPPDTVVESDAPTTRGIQFAEENEVTLEQERSEYPWSDEPLNPNY